MLRISQLRLPLEHTEEELDQKVRKLLKTDKIHRIEIVRRSVDARKKPELFFNYVLNVEADHEARILQRADKRAVRQLSEEPYRFPLQNYTGSKRPVIIGAGPAGLFCAYFLAEAGFKPLVLERGKPVEEREEDVKAFWENGKLDPQSNVQFGEGGAGTFSDGKLNTLVKDTYGRNRAVLSVFVKEGAPKEILYDHKPHIGTDLLKTIIRNMREHILSLGGEIRFRSQVTDFIIDGGCIKALLINGEERLEADTVVLAPGHSARDTFFRLHERGIAMEAKPFAVGFRVEHPQSLINRSQYGKEESPLLGNASYKLAMTDPKNGRGVYSFCMCPGGYVVNASSEEGRLAVNGMSYSKRDGSNANSAIIVSVTPKDYGSRHPLAGIEFQRKLEEKAYQAGGGRIPVERFGDFQRAVFPESAIEETALSGELEEELANYQPKIKGDWEYASVHTILPQELNEAFVRGMCRFGKQIKGFSHPGVYIDGLESRTSSPVRILRDASLQASVAGIYPCGEGAGYAGGITSAAMDGIKIAELIAQKEEKADGTTGQNNA